MSESESQRKVETGSTPGNPTTATPLEEATGSSSPAPAAVVPASAAPIPAPAPTSAPTAQPIEADVCFSLGFQG